MQPVELGAPEVVVGPGTRFSVGGTLSRSFAAWKRNWPFLLLVAVLSLLPGFLLSLVLPPETGFFKPATRLDRGLNAILAYVATGFVTISVLDQLRGRPRNIRRSLAVGASRVGALVLTAFGTGFVTEVLLLLLVVPGLIVIVRWVLVAPIVILEPGVDAWARSSALTKGHRWEVFGIVTVIHVGRSLLFGVIATVVGLRAARLPPGESSLLFDAVIAFPGVLFVSFRSVLEVVLYEQLRAEKEGVDLTQLTAVFE